MGLDQHPAFAGVPQTVPPFLTVGPAVVFDTFDLMLDQTRGSGHGCRVSYWSHLCDPGSTGHHAEGGNWLFLVTEMLPKNSSCLRSVSETQTNPNRPFQPPGNVAGQLAATLTTVTEQPGNSQADLWKKNKLASSN